MCVVSSRSVECTLTQWDRSRTTSRAAGGGRSCVEIFRVGGGYFTVLLRSKDDNKKSTSKYSNIAQPQTL
ncbi:hypothetical protein LDENG_00297980 [Lucifuga dentata]|nr:hypothetical protein LDENG_00297980 [Lucifuga dentata]